MQYMHIPSSYFVVCVCVCVCVCGVQAAEKIGYPVMIKASEGGGGKGIRRARNSDEFPSLFYQVQAEVPGSPIFVMKLARKSVTERWKMALLSCYYASFLLG